MKQETIVIEESWNTDSEAYEMLARYLVKKFVAKASDKVQENIQAV